MTKFGPRRVALALSSRKPVGSQRSWTPNSQASMTPSQKMGMETPVRAHTRERLSHTEFRHTADTMPTGMPRTTPGPWPPGPAPRWPGNGAGGRPGRAPTSRSRCPGRPGPRCRRRGGTARHGPVEAQPLPDLGHLLGRGPLPQHGQGRVAGDQAHEGEDQHRHADQHRHHRQGPPDGVAPHSLMPHPGQLAGPGPAGPRPRSTLAAPPVEGGPSRDRPHHWCVPLPAAASPPLRMESLRGVARPPLRGSTGKVSEGVSEHPLRSLLTGPRPC